MDWLLLFCLWMLFLPKARSSCEVAREGSNHTIKYKTAPTSDPSRLWKKDGIALIDCAVGETLAKRVECDAAVDSTKISGNVDLSNNWTYSLFIPNITRSDQGVFVLGTQQPSPQPEVFYTCNLKTYAQAEDVKRKVRWSTDGIQVEYAINKVYPIVTMTLSNGNNNNGVSSGCTNSEYLVDGVTYLNASCYLNITRDFLKLNQFRATVQLFLRFKDADENNKISIHNDSFTYTQPTVKLTCATLNHERTLINCTCRRMDRSDASTQFSWSLNNDTAFNKSILAVESQPNARYSILTFEDGQKVREASCRAEDVFGETSEDVYPLPNPLENENSNHAFHWNVILACIFVSSCLVIIVFLIVIGRRFNCLKRCRKFKIRSNGASNGSVLITNINPHPETVPLIEISLHLYLIGEIGSGKSATGNTIVGKRVFESSGCSNPVTKTHHICCFEYDKYHAAVVDGPGLSCFDSTKYLDVIKNLKRLMQDLKSRYCPIFLYVYRCGQRMSEDDPTIEVYEKHFGASFFTSSCIIIITYIDAQRADKEEVLSPQAWLERCLAEKGPFARIVEKCGKRVVFFNNTCMDQCRKNQLPNLFKEVHQLRKRNVDQHIAPLSTV